MKQAIIIPIVIFCLFGCNINKANQDDAMAAFSIQEFVDIIRDSSFLKFKTLVNKPGYELDSSLSGKEGIHYSAEDTTKEDGDYTSIQMTKDRHIDFLNFLTSNKKLYKQFERQISEMGFKKLDDDPVVKEFTLNKVYLSIVITGDKKSPSYMFSFVRDDRKDTFK